MKLKAEAPGKALTSGLTFDPKQREPSNALHPFPENPTSRTSLVAQWLRIRLPMQGTRVRSLVREDPTCCGATKPVRHNY